MPRRTPISSVDAAWLGMEDPTNLMMVTGVMALEGTIDPKRLLTTLDRRLAPFSRFHQRVVRPRTRAGIAHWEDDPEFDVDNHLTHVALVRVLLSLTDESADAKPPARAARRSAGASAFPLEWLPAAIRRGLKAGQDLASHPDRVLEVARLGAPGAYRLGRLVVLPPDPRTVFKGKLGRRKLAAWSETLPLEDFKAIGKAHGATVNDVLVAAATGALRRYMERRGDATAGV